MPDIRETATYHETGLHARDHTMRGGLTAALGIRQLEDIARIAALEAIIGSRHLLSRGRLASG